MTFKINDNNQNKINYIVAMFVIRHSISEDDK